MPECTIHVHSSCSAQTGQHKGECCSCLGTATWSLMELNVVNGGSQVAVAPATPSRARGWARGSRCLIHAGAARALRLAPRGEQS